MRRARIVSRLSCRIERSLGVAGEWRRNHPAVAAYRRDERARNVLVDYDLVVFELASIRVTFGMLIIYGSLA
jgi:hypothetical protein